MPGKLKVRVVSGRNLPVMDRASELTDAFVEVKFGSTILKTEVCRKSLNPQWNSDWFRFEVDDEDLQDEPLQIRVLDHDTYTSHDAIGKIYIDLNPLLNDNKTSTFGGWYPIYDTMHGIQGQLYVVIKIDLFSDLNKFRKSSCGVKFFCTSRVPEGYQIETFLGFVEELTVNDDPEYQWIDRIRSMRASNEARQMIFSKLSGQLQRKIGLKVLEMGGNAVIGYRQCFDLEGESGVVVRAIGTCVTLKRAAKLGQGSSPAVALNTSGGAQNESITQDCSTAAALSVAGVNSSLPVPVSSAAATGQSGSGFFPSLSPTCMASLTCHSINMPSSTGHGKLVAASRRLSESDAETPAKGGGGLLAVNTALLNQSKTPFHRPIMHQENIEMMEYPFFTMRLYPRGCIKHLGGVVSATSVKLLDKMNDPDEPKTRDLWWAELRTEIRSHTRALNCNCVLGYSERTSIRDELIILSANGTAAILNPSNIISAASSTEDLAGCHKSSCGQSNRSKGRTGSLTAGCSAPSSNGQPSFWLTDPKLNRKYQRDLFMGKPSVLGRPRLLSVSDDEENDSRTVNKADVSNHDIENRDGHVNVMNKNDEDESSDSSSISVFPQCSICHIPYHERELPFPVSLCKCLVCQQYKVPDIIFCTIEPPEELPIIGKGCLIQARICRPKREGKGESNAKEVSDSLPFIEYELHKQLVNKLKVKGMNSLFGLTIQLTVGESLVVAVATATGVYSEPLPPPGVPLIINKNDSTLSEVELQSIRSNLAEAIKRNKEAYKITEQVVPKPGGIVVTDVEDFSVNDVKWPDETFVFEIDDTEDAQVVSVLLEPPYPVDFEFCNTERMPGLEGIVVCNLQMFTKIWRGPLKSACNSALDAVVDNVIKSLFFKFRSMRPCVICKLEFDLDLTNEDELQILITGMCSGIGRIVDQVVEESGRTSSNTLVSKMSVNKQGNSLDKTEHCFDFMEQPPPTIESPSTLTNFRMGGAICDSRHNVSSSIMSSISIAENHRLKHHSGKTKPFGIQLSPLSWVPRATVLSYMGHLNFFLIRESTSVREDGGLNCFMHSFLAEVMAICRSHVRSLGGNALVSFRIVECTLQNNVHKNQSQCLVNVFGDAVNVVYDPDSVTASHLSLEHKATNQAEEPAFSRL